MPDLTAHGPYSLPTPDRRNAKILIVEDAAFDVDILRDAIEDMATITVAGTAAEALDLIARTEFDVILLDVLLPDTNGFELCRRLTGEAGSRDTPIIFISCLDDSRSEETGLSIGAADYITKPFVPKVVRARVRNQVALARATRELRQANDRLALLAATDPLTGLFNRRQFDQLLAAWADHGDRGDACFLMLDLDLFKDINDLHGHDAGDEVLAAVAKAWAERLRPHDILARLGGEEFAALLPDTPCDQGRTIAERLRLATAETVICVAGQTLPITTSIGIACCPAGTNADPHRLRRRADQALYAAKRQGRNRVCLAGPDDAFQEAP